MATDIPTQEPQHFTAGDTVKWDIALSDYPATSWTLTYALTPLDGAADGRITFTAAASGTDHRVSLTPATTAAFTAGAYGYWATVSDGTDRHLVRDGQITIHPDPATASAVDARTHARRMRDQLRDLYSKLSTRETQTGSVNGKTYTLRDLGEVQRQLTQWEWAVQAEEDRERRRRGEPARAVTRYQFART